MSDTKAAAREQMIETARDWYAHGTQCVSKDPITEILADFAIKRVREAVREAFEEVIGDGSLDGHLGVAYRSRMDAVLAEMEAKENETD